MDAELELIGVWTKLSYVEMADRLRASIGLSPRYVNSQLGQLSLVSSFRGR